MQPNIQIWWGREIQYDLKLKGDELDYKNLKLCVVVLMFVVSGALISFLSFLSLLDKKIREEHHFKIKSILIFLDIFLCLPFLCGPILYILCFFFFFMHKKLKYIKKSIRTL